MTEERRVRSLLDYWPLIVVASGGIVTAITFYNNVKQIVDDQKTFHATVDTRRDQTHKDMEDIRTRLTKLETWKEDISGKLSN